MAKKVKQIIMTMNAFPSLFSTYQRAFRLWATSFIDLLPFLLLWMLSQILLETFLPQKDQIDGMFFLTMFLDMIISALFFGVVLSGLYQRHQSQVFDFIGAFKTGVRRLIPNFLAYALVTIPLILVLLGFALLLAFGKLLPVTWVMNILSWQHAIILIAALLSLALVVLFFVTGVCIVVLQEGVWSALRHSYLLVKSVWIDTLLLVVLFGIIAAFANLILQEITIPYAKAVVTLLLSSFYPALMLMHFENVVQYAQGSHATVHVPQIAQKSHQV